MAHRFIALAAALAIAGLAAPVSAQTTTTPAASSPTTTAAKPRKRGEADDALINKIIEESLERTRRAKELGIEERFER